MALLSADGTRQKMNNNNTNNSVITIQSFYICLYKLLHKWE